MLYNLFYMKKVSAREFLHGFASLQKSLKPGESVTITKHGEPLGEFVKHAQTQTGAELPDFERDAKALGFDVKEGDALLARLLADEALS